MYYKKKMKKSADFTIRISKDAIKIPNGYNAVSLDELKNELFGETGVEERDSYEAELKEEILGM